MSQASLVKILGSPSLCPCLVLPLYIRSGGEKKQKTMKDKKDKLNNEVLADHETQRLKKEWEPKIVQNEYKPIKEITNG